MHGDVTSAVKRTGGAVALCSYTTIIGYGSLLFADNQALQSFGRLAMSGEFACLSGALLVLPSLLHMIGVLRQKDVRPSHEHEMVSVPSSSRGRSRPVEATREPPSEAPEPPTAA